MPPLTTSVAILGAGFLLIVGGSALFTHSLEATVARYFDNRNRGLRILGNLSLSLPELILPLIAFLLPGTGGTRVAAGTGALFGSPLFLCLFLSPLFILLRPAHARTLLREIPFLLAGVVGTLALFGQPQLPRLGWGVALAALYLWGLVSTPEEGRDDPSPPPPSPWSFVDALSLGGGALLMGIGSHLFLSGVEHLQELRGFSPFWTALILAPLATEAPELLTLTHFLRKKSLSQSFSILWGSIHLQATLGLAAGLIASPWKGSPEVLHAGESLGAALAFLFAVGLIKRPAREGR